MTSGLEPFDAPGLPADWLNGWLAAIGVTALAPGVKLSWTDAVIPHGVFRVPSSIDLPDALWRALTSADALDASALARQYPGAHHELGRKVTVEAYQERARLERRDGGYLLAGSLSDLQALDPGETVPHGAFDPPAPRGETLFSRALACRAHISDASQVRASLEGTGPRVPINGLGFDCRRHSSGVRADGRATQVDPVVELLALAALRIFPVRGDGRRVRQRGWLRASSQRGAFTWFTWTPALDLHAIDALLDQPDVAATARWQVVPLRPSNPSDVTRAYFSESVS